MAHQLESMNSRMFDSGRVKGEPIELAIRKELADEATLRNYFRSITVDYYSVFESWIKESRKANKNPTGYSEMEELSKRWGQDSGPKS